MVAYRMTLSTRHWLFGAEGGVVLFLLALALLVPVFAPLRRLEIPNRCTSDEFTAQGAIDQRSRGQFVSMSSRQKPREIVRNFATKSRGEALSLKRTSRFGRHCRSLQLTPSI